MTTLLSLIDLRYCTTNRGAQIRVLSHDLMRFRHVSAEWVRLYGAISIAGRPAAFPTHGFTVGVDHSLGTIPKFFTVKLLSKETCEFFRILKKIVNLCLSWAIGAEVTGVTTIPTFPFRGRGSEF